MKGTFQRNNGAPTRFKHRMLQRGFYRLGTRIGKHTAKVAVRSVAQFLSQVFGQWLVRTLRVKGQARCQHSPSFGEKSGMRMPQQQ